MCHASGGTAMLEGRGRRRFPIAIARQPHVIGVTVLTSLNDNDLAELGRARCAGTGLARSPACATPRCLGGVVCSPRKSPCCARKCRGISCSLRREYARPGDASGDQKRVMGRARPSPRGRIIWWSAGQSPARKTPRRRSRNLCRPFQAFLRICTSLFWRPQGCFFFQLRIRTPS